jgi:hypothetical protein
MTVAGIFRVIRTALAAIGARRPDPEPTHQAVNPNAAPPAARPSDQAYVDAPSAASESASRPPRKGGRPRKHFVDRDQAATPAERVTLSRERRRRASKLKSGFETSFETGFETSPEPPSKIQENKKTEAHPISENWWPDDDGYQLGIQAFGAGDVDAAIATHRDTWLSRPERLTDKQWQAKWRAWCRLHIAPRLPLGLHLATTERVRQHGQHSGSSGRGRRSPSPTSKTQDWAKRRKSEIKPTGGEGSSDGAAADATAGDRYDNPPDRQLEGSQGSG